ncbi:DNA polymerase III subunit chi [Reinekea marinisedimentorum]|uniref:DNA polymerase III chi subunit n=1 Tax=Reinekea marinisedimentorum TaxID=230495 RepID=A0A4R3I5P0_9GAMM|nr:DNA polymerase III subunit chi [Reinekea marinisedimentorum]TCS41328.1 DNA polymerase III chi subunit [Reinekea marinisedimentorum]
MTKIDFHILPSDQDTQRYKYVARLVHKAQSRNHQILIATESEAQAQEVSNALWSLSSEAFLAHTTVSNDHYPLQISFSGHCGEHHDILINLCHQTPEYFPRFGRVFEVVSQRPDLLESSRTRYRFYQDRGYALTRHDLRDRMTQ